HSTRTFHDMTAAIDYAAANTNTLSPRFPAGYRSATVRMLEALGAETRAALLGLRPTEEITLSGDALPAVEALRLPEDVLREEGQARLMAALEAHSVEEANTWVERAHDLFNKASRLEIRREQLQKDDGQRESSGSRDDAYRHHGGRVSKPIECR
ncbi:MAG: hypothetical protein ACYTEQ_27540, partial [Planctomycetota bacterium]